MVLIETPSTFDSSSWEPVSPAKSATRCNVMKEEKEQKIKTSRKAFKADKGPSGFCRHMNEGQQRLQADNGRILDSLCVVIINQLSVYLLGVIDQLLNVFHPRLCRVGVSLLGNISGG
jgi:hypothetical protein